ncbi:hypothetical protein [Streptomyces umbrinus]|uniref:hypothetical protein n=1 Tax=Streptomyces umbrinus TaxID=67370 RepID=UPI0033F16AC1
MAGFRDFLTRFRPAATPGRAAPGGVPADRSAVFAAELVPPLALLDQAEAEARSIRERAARAAEEKRREAEARAEQIVAAAHADARLVRAESADRTVHEAETEAADLRDRAIHEVAAVRERATARMPLLIDRVAALTAEELTPLREPSSTTSTGTSREGPP